MIRISTLMDNKPSENKSLINEHGLSYLVDDGTHRILFDCGAGGAVWENAHRLGEDVTGAHAVVLSHSHYDHASGYKELVELGGGRLLYTGEHFFEKKYAFNGVKYTDLSAGFTEAFLKEHQVERRVCEDVLEIFPGVWIVGNFPRIHPFETIAERFVKQTEDGLVQDLFEDEICMAVETSKGLVVLVGCSHPGILNMMTKIYETLKKPLYAVFGGTHLVEADAARVEETVRRLKDMGLKILGLGHCSGDAAEQQICMHQEVMSCHMAAGDNIFFE